MPSIKKIIFFRRVAVLLSIVWTLMTYSFFTYQMNNEKSHIEQNILQKAKTTTNEAKDLIIWEFNRKIEARKSDYNFDFNTGFSLRDLIYEIAKKQNIKIKIEGNYLEDDFDGLDKKVKTVIQNSQKTKKDIYTIYSKNNDEYIFYFKPLEASESCLKCHVHDDSEVGDVLGNINISMKIPTPKEFNPSNYYFLIVTYLSTWLAGLAVIWFIRYKSREFFDEKMKHYEESIYYFVDMIEKRDSYTAGHSKRVAVYAKEIAKELKLKQNDIELIYRAGMLHDIGKIEVPDALLLKPDYLTKNEYEIIKTHSKVGYELLSREPFLDLASIVLYHHENYDGSGYPYGLSGDEIPFLSQIISVADVYDALTTNRSYREALSKEDALKIIKEESGKKFNPSIVKAAIIIFEKMVLEDSFPIKNSDFVKDIRFSYYYRDQLTGYYNINYLKFLLSHTQKYTIQSACHINFINFAKYNTKYGWKKGDKVLQDFSDVLSNECKPCLLIRLFSDNFLLLNLESKINLDLDVIDKFTKEYEVKIEYKFINISSKNIDTFDKLEDLILSG
jgi:putative nucleotidyltransferase with HDIG domain